MLGHDDVSPQVVGMKLPSAINGVEQPLTSALFAEEWLSLKAGEGQGMGMAWVVVPFALFPVRHGDRIACDGVSSTLDFGYF